jgi:hypothetical protein
MIKSESGKISLVGTHCLVFLPDNMRKDNVGYILNTRIVPHGRSGQRTLYLVAHNYGISWIDHVEPAQGVIDKSFLNLPTPLEVDYLDLRPEDTKPLFGDYKYSWDYVGIDYRK